MKKISIFLCAIAFLHMGFGLAGAAVLNFEDQTLGSSYSSLTIGDITFTALDNHLLIDNTAPREEQQGLYLSNGTYENNGFYNLRIDFAYAVDSFGFSWGMSEPWAIWVLNAYNSSGTLLSSLNMPVSSGRSFFVGTSGSGISYATLSNSTDYDWIGIDNFTYESNAVPEPATLLLLGLGMAGLAGAKRKFKR